MFTTSTAKATTTCAPTNTPLAVDGPVDCSICCCEIEDDAATLCCAGDERHFIDGDCFTHLLGTLGSDSGSLTFFKQHRALKCPLCTAGISADLVYASGDAVLIKNYVETTQQMACSIERLEAQAQAEKQAIEDSADAKKNLVRRMLTEIDDVMTSAIACPHCATPFFDFAGCLSLTCANCAKEFCGVCLKKHGRTTDGHQQVAECTSKMAADQLKQFDFHSTYFISGTGWERWREKLKCEALYDYLRGLRQELVWEYFHQIAQKLTTEKLLAKPTVDQLKNMVFSHKHGDNLHLVRLPNCFWLIYSAKKNVRFIDAVQRVQLTSDELKDMGLVVVARIRKAFPNWEAVRKQVPGETFQSINYPVECLPLIAEAIADWGKGRYW